MFAAVVIVATAALSAVAEGLVMLLGGETLAKELAAITVANTLGISVQEAKSMGGDQLEGLQGLNSVSTLEARGYVIVTVGGLLLLFGLLTYRAAVWARVMVTIVAVPAMALSALIALDSATTLMRVLAGMVVIGSVAIIVLSWLPPTNAYARYLRTSAK